MDKSKNLEEKKINLIHENQNLQNKNNDNKIQKEKIEDNEIIIELEIFNNENEKNINILCDKNQLIIDNKRNKNYYKENNIIPPKIFNYFNKDNTKLYLNDKEIKFNYKININNKGINKIKIKSKIKLFYLT